MLVDDMRSEPNQTPNSFTLVIDNFIEKKVVKFTFDARKREWNDPVVKHACEDKDRLVNCFFLDDNVLILATQRGTTMIDCREKGAKIKPSETLNRRSLQFKMPMSIRPG